jgi:glycosyltransferase involved in cell wall biosynthesis
MTASLSIAIPTYNGACSIREVLDNIIAQLDNIDESIEVVVSDKASTDQTAEIVSMVQMTYPFIKYFRNEANLGADRNIDLAVRRSKGEFVWLFSDHDGIKDGGLKRVVEVIDKNPDIAAVFVNYETNYPFNCSQDCLCSNGNDFFARTCFRNSLMSSTIIKKAEWERVDTSKYFDTSWIHVGVLIEALSSNRGFIISSPLVFQGQVVQRWAVKGAFFAVSLRLATMINDMGKCGYDADLIKNSITLFHSGLVTNVINAKRMGLKVDFDLIRKVHVLFKHYPSFWIVDLPLLLLPRQLYNIRTAKSIYRNRITRLMYRMGTKTYRRLKGKRQ